MSPLLPLRTSHGQDPHLLRFTGSLLILCLDHVIHCLNHTLKLPRLASTLHYQLRGAQGTLDQAPRECQTEAPHCASPSTSPQQVAKAAATDRRTAARERQMSCESHTLNMTFPLMSDNSHAPCFLNTSFANCP